MGVRCSDRQAEDRLVGDCEVAGLGSAGERPGPVGMHRTRPPKATEAIPGLAVHAPVATNSAQGFSISECGAAAFQTGVEFSLKFCGPLGRGLTAACILDT